MEGLTKLLGPAPAGMKKTELHYTTQDDTKTRADLHQPTTTPLDASPLIVVYHGGGYYVGGPEGDEQTCHTFVYAFGAVCISASYRLAPEFKYPYAVTDAWDALKWAATNAHLFGADPSRGFVVGGTSAGINLVTAVTLRARDKGLAAPLTGQYLATPAVLPSNKVPAKYKHLYLSMEQNRESPTLPGSAIDILMGAYQPDVNDPRYTPFLHPKGFANLPPTYLQVRADI